ncbi:rod shape-determining protein MreD [Deinococcus sp. QL22]|uniref:rod shape-determining protein MreD n=1 Tax=Deinococcus sp. QL22 TaxID=2939437 RepID=UPI002017E756|nr:rod shape-determining protein MreD [Deinococcus sp. QL22]UQN05909.1 rod shape-determining protein MreD [Deinococcus sp. QL22]
MIRRSGRNTGLAPRGPGRWVGVVVYVLLLLIVQGVLSRLLDPLRIPAPDLFLLTGAALAWRLPPVQAVVAGYGVGLIQDVLGGGALGLHAAGVGAGAVLVLLVRRYVGDSGIFQALFTVLAATTGQWLAFLFLTYWLRSDLVTVDTLRQTVPLALLSTLLIYPFWNRLVTWGMGERPGPEDGLS